MTSNPSTIHPSFPLTTIPLLGPTRTFDNRPFNMSSNGENQFTSAKYQGHTAPVLSLAVSEDYSCLLSGSEDHTARLWDLRNNSRRRASLCIQTGGEVLSVAFTPKNGVEETPAEVSTSPFAKDHSMYVLHARFDAMCNAIQSVFSLLLVFIAVF